MLEICDIHSRDFGIGVNDREGTREMIILKVEHYFFKKILAKSTAEHEKA